MSGEDDGFNSKNWVWVPDSMACYLKGYVTDYLNDGKCKVTVINENKEEHRIVENDQIESCNPSKFNKCDDMAALTHLNEPSVVYNMYLRYNDDMIYTYSGLFLVAINPYKSLPIYDQKTLEKYHSQDFDKPPPHIYATAEGTYRNLLSNHKNQSILVTGESGAGKTENTKKIIQYLSSITPENRLNMSSTIDSRILQANPILESFGNAKTIKNNNSSRFGKFVKVYFTESGCISGANIDYYLLEKSRVVTQAVEERNYHIFYQLLKGYDVKKLKVLGLTSAVEDYSYLNNVHLKIPHVDDKKDFNTLVEAFKILGLQENEIDDIFSILAVILQFGNLEFTSWKAEQASFKSDSLLQTILKLLGIEKKVLAEFLLRPKVKAGREMVQKSKRPPEVKFAIDALSKHFYEKLFQYIIGKINLSLNIDATDVDLSFIGVLDIAGFEIFTENSFEQLCINYTNEKLQQFFNHHSFILEQSEYLREDIQWEFIDFGLDLQPTIDLIELRRPLGIFKVLDEECVVPKASDKSFMDKLSMTWGNGQSKKFRLNKFKSGFIVHHYAGEVEYNVDNWLQKNTDPVSENILSILPSSESKFIREVFTEDIEIGGKTKIKMKTRTLSQKHKDQLSNLMEQLSLTEPHFVRCILPNLYKKPNRFDKNLVLNQLRCNGVLEGIRITRAGYPNRMTFDEFYSRYSITNVKEVFTKNNKTNSELLIKYVDLDPNSYKIGITKIFFKNGVLGKLEELRDLSLKGIFTDLQSLVRGKKARKTIEFKIREIQSSQVVARNFEMLEDSLSRNLWFSLFIKIKPLLEDSVKLLDSKEMNKSLKEASDKLKDLERLRNSLDDENKRLKDQITKLETEVISVTDIVKEKDIALKKVRSDEANSLKKTRSIQNELDQLRSSNKLLNRQKEELDEKLARKVEELNQNLKQRDLLANDHKVSLEKIKELKEKITTLELENKNQVDAIEVLNNDISRSKSEADSRYEEIEQKNRMLLSELDNFKETKHNKLTDEIAEHRDTISHHLNTISVQNDELNSLKSNHTKSQLRVKEMEDELNDNVTKLGTLESQLSIKLDEVQSLKDKCKVLEKKYTEILEEKGVLISRENQLNDILKEESKKSNELSSLKEKWVTISKENSTLSRSLEELKVQLQVAIASKTKYSEEIVSLRNRLQELEEKESEKGRNVNGKENVPPDSQFLEDYSSMKIKMNEQNAILRKERFENKKLNEEISLLKERISNHTEELLLQRNQVDKKPPRTSELEETKNEIETLKKSLQQEETNVQRAENYAIELQKKLNKLQSAKPDDLSKRNNVSSSSNQEESIFDTRRITENDRSISYTDSLSKSLLLRANNNLDFLAIYQDVTKTLKFTRDELSSSKSEILRLKALLRDSEDELYNTKRQTVRSTISDYENELSQLKAKANSFTSKNRDLEKATELYKKRSEEYYEKLELAESAVSISKRQEQAALKDLLETKNQLTLAREEARATQILVKDMRKLISRLEEAVLDKDFELSQTQTQAKELQDKVDYLYRSYGSKETNDKYKEDIRNLNRDLNFKLETETKLIKENKRLQLDNEDLVRVKIQLDKDNADMATKVTDLEDLSEDLKKKKASLEEEKASHERKLAGLSKQVSSLKELVNDISEERDNLINSRNQLSQKVTELMQSYEEKTMELQNSESSIIVLREHLENQRRASKEVEAELNQSKSSSTYDAQDQLRLRNEILVIGEENDSLKRANKELNTKVHDLELKLYSNEQLKYWEDKVERLTDELDTAHNKFHESSKTVTNLKRELKLLEIRIDNESRLTKKYNDENFDYQNKVNHYKSTIDILHNETIEKDLQLKSREREISEMKENKLLLEKEVLELSDQLRANNII
ncbi:uncharacterized protein PRCAT00005996001 [Priceomyces carsonii]|uniref:uncharacterized protein n=1 Tax=Priceomyces carsonii TaxID=28549 RepID=UPI002ED8A034|nr:unnamed protein product [Priceomyces carsonii]